MKVIPISINDSQIIPSTYISLLLTETPISNTPIHNNVRTYVYPFRFRYHNVVYYRYLLNK